MPLDKVQESCLLTSVIPFPGLKKEHPRKALFWETVTA